jgi:hypothetical protein
MTRTRIDWTKPTALYRLFNVTGDLLYIGIASDPEERFRAHSKVQPWWPDVASRQVEWHEDRWKADDAETIAIAIERPERNFASKNAPTIDLTPHLGRAGLYQPLRDVLVAVTKAAVTAPGRVAAAIGIPSDVLTLHSWHVYERDGTRLWGAASWEYPGTRGMIEEAWSTRPDSVTASARPATALEAITLSLPAGSTVDTWGFTGVSIARRRRNCLTEAIWPEGAREERRAVSPERLEREEAEAASLRLRKAGTITEVVGGKDGSLYRHLATALVRPAREALGMDHEEFAGWLDSVLGWKVTAGAVGHWEAEIVPPGDIVLACADIVRKSAAITDAHLSAEARVALALLSPSLADLEQADPALKESSVTPLTSTRSWPTPSRPASRAGASRATAGARQHEPRSDTPKGRKARHEPP